MGKKLVDVTNVLVEFYKDRILIHIYMEGAVNITLGESNIDNWRTLHTHNAQ